MTRHLSLLRVTASAVAVALMLLVPQSPGWSEDKGSARVHPVDRESFEAMFPEGWKTAAEFAPADQEMQELDELATHDRGSWGDAFSSSEFHNISMSDALGIASQVPSEWQADDRYVFSTDDGALLVDISSEATDGGLATTFALHFVPNEERVGPTQFDVLKVASHPLAAQENAVEITTSTGQFESLELTVTDPIDSACLSSCTTPATVGGLAVNAGCAVLRNVGPVGRFACFAVTAGLAGISLHCNNIRALKTVGSFLEVDPPNCAYQTGGSASIGYESCGVSGSMGDTRGRELSASSKELLAIWTRADATTIYTFHDLGWTTLRGADARYWKISGVAQDNLGVDINCAVTLEPVFTMKFTSGGGMTSTAGPHPKPAGVC